MVREPTEIETQSIKHYLKSKYGIQSVIQGNTLKLTANGNEHATLIINNLFIQFSSLFRPIMPRGQEDVSFHMGWQERYEQFLY